MAKRNKPSRKNIRTLKENYELLKTSWTVQTKVFFENSSLHGVRYIAESGRPFFEKFLWFACVLIGAIATVVIIISLWEKFQTNPTITGLDTDFHNWDVPFPAITLCQTNPSSLEAIEAYLNKSESYSEENVEYLKDLSELTIESITEFVKKYNEKQTGIQSKNIKKTVYGLMNKCEDIFTECSFKSYNISCCDHFFPVFTEIGFCYAFNSRLYEIKPPNSNKTYPKFEMKYIQETDLKWSLKFGVKNPVNPILIYILNSDEMAGIDMQPQHIWTYTIDTLAFSVKQTYTTTDTRQLTIKQRHCAFADEIQLKIDDIYTYTACTRQCRMDIAMELCKCVPHFYLNRNNRYPHCNNMDQLKCIARNIKKLHKISKCSCYLGCFNTIYELEKMNVHTGSSIASDLEAEFVSWPVIRYKREVLFGWVDLLVAFGGIAGLFLGFSLLSGVEILYYFTLRACCMIVKDKNELKRIQKQEKLNIMPDYDLSLMPYWIKKPKPGAGIDEVSKYNKNLVYHSNIISVLPKNEKSKKGIVPPFGIDFVN